MPEVYKELDKYGLSGIDHDDDLLNESEKAKLMRIPPISSNLFEKYYIG